MRQCLALTSNASNAQEVLPRLGALCVEVLDEVLTTDGSVPACTVISSAKTEIASVLQDASSASEKKALCNSRSGLRVGLTSARSSLSTTATGSAPKTCAERPKTRKAHQP